MKIHYYYHLYKNSYTKNGIQRGFLQPRSHKHANRDYKGLFCEDTYSYLMELPASSFFPMHETTEVASSFMQSCVQADTISQFTHIIERLP